MNKKGFFIQFWLDIYGWLIIAIGMLFWIVIFSFFKPEVTYSIGEQTPYISDDTTILSYLRTPAGDGKIISDLVSEVYYGASPDKLTNELTIILNRVYGIAKPVCWKLWYYEGDSIKEKVLAKEECAGEQRDILDAETIIPLQNKKSIKLRLIVPGYKE